MCTLSDLLERREAELRLAAARVALVQVLLDHAEKLELEGLRLDVEDWDGRLALALELDGAAPAPVARPSAATSGPAEWTDMEDARILSLSHDGDNVKEIAKKVGRTWQAVAFRLKKLREAADAEADEPAPPAEPEPEPAPAPDAEPEPAPDAEPEPAPEPVSVGAAHWLVMDNLSAREKAAERRLRGMGYPGDCSPASDLALVQSLGIGDGMSMAADKAGLTVDVGRARWKALLPEVTIEEQAALVSVLKKRAAT